MLALSAVAAWLRRGIPMIAAAALVNSIPLAAAQQYPPPAFPNPGYSAPDGPSSPAYPYPGYGARRSAAASARGDPGPARRHHGLATRVLGLAQTRLGLGVRSLRLPPVPTRALDS